MAIDGADELAVCVGAKIADPSGAACVDLLRDLALRRLDLLRDLALRRLDLGATLRRRSSLHRWRRQAGPPAAAHQP
jgi:hypothetical protein